MADDRAIVEAALTKPLPDMPLVLCEDGTMLLGPKTEGALVRFINYYQELRKNKQPIPLGLLTKWIAERISHPTDKQDVICGLFGGRGMGKSRISLALCAKVAIQLSKITGKDPSYYFSIANVISLADGPEIARRLSEIPDCSCVIIDDAGTGINSRDFQSKSNKGILKIISTVRTKRLFIVINAPNRTHIDVALRQMILLDGFVHKPLHSVGANIMRMSRTTLSPVGKEYHANLVGMAGKVNYWLVENADDKLVAEYDRVRKQSADSLAEDVSDGLMPQMVVKKMTAAEKREAEYVKHGDTVRKMLKENPKTTGTSISNACGINTVFAGQLRERIRKEMRENHGG